LICSNKSATAVIVKVTPSSHPGSRPFVRSFLFADRLRRS
jgi:hypothetical protein